ncbi:hypothetical protein B9Z19DRAFT_999626, partial [Tuber borchii]
KFCLFFLHFFASNCLQMSLYTILLEGVLLSYNPLVRKSVFKSDHFLIQPPLRCNTIYKCTSYIQGGAFGAITIQKRGF